MRSFILKCCILIFFSGCIVYGCGEDKNSTIGRLQEEVSNLKNENASLRKDCAKHSIQESGDLFSISIISVTVIVINNLIWFIVYRRKS
jgi:hypothetical protein